MVSIQDGRRIPWLGAATCRLQTTSGYATTQSLSETVLMSSLRYTKLVCLKCNASQASQSVFDVRVLYKTIVAASLFHPPHNWHISAHPTLLWAEQSTIAYLQP